VLSAILDFWAQIAGNLKTPDVGPGFDMAAGLNDVLAYPCKPKQGTAWYFPYSPPLVLMLLHKTTIYSRPYSNLLASTASHYLDYTAPTATS
jgi:hypothetical protein